MEFLTLAKWKQLTTRERAMYKVSVVSQGVDWDDFVAQWKVFLAKESVDA